MKYFWITTFSIFASFSATTLLLYVSSLVLKEDSSSVKIILFKIQQNGGRAKKRKKQTNATIVNHMTEHLHVQRHYSSSHSPLRREHRWEHLQLRQSVCNGDDQYGRHNNDDNRLMMILEIAWQGSFGHLATLERINSCQPIPSCQHPKAKFYFSGAPKNALIQTFVVLHNWGLQACLTCF